MSEKKKKSSQIIAFTPDAITLSIGGENVLVPITKGENAFLNMVLAAQGRTLIQRTLAHWKEQDAVPSPKELRDIAGAMRDVAAFSAEVYATAEPVSAKDPEKKAEQAEEIDFEELTKPIEPNGTGKEFLRNDESTSAPKAPEAGTGEPAS